MKFWRSTSNRLSDTADLQESATLPGLNRLWPRPKRRSAANSYTAAYLFHLCQNHAFIDGNKRAGASAAITFLLMNNWEPTLDEEELVELVLSVASRTLSKPRLIEIFESRCKPLADAGSHAQLS
jgi:hypothetical protein